MPTYKCLRPFLLQKKHPGGQITTSVYDAGALVEYDGNPGDSLEPTCDEGRKRQAAYFEERARKRAEAAMNASDQTRAMVAAMHQLFKGLGSADEEPAPRRRRRAEADEAA